MNSSEEEQKDLTKILNFSVEYKYIMRKKDSILRILKLTNIRGKSKLIEFTSGELTDIKSFKEKIYNHGEFYFLGNINHFNKLLQQLESQEPKEIEIVDRLGYFYEGMFITSNILYFLGDEILKNKEEIFEVENENFKINNSNQIKLVKGVEEKEYTKILKEFIDLQYKSLNDNWEGLIALAYLRASLYASFLIKEFGSFPFLLVVGEKGSGKNFFCQTLLKVIGIDSTGDGIPSSTQVGILRKSTQLIDLPYWLDEYSDNFSSGKKIEGLLRSAYNRSPFVKADLANSTEIKSTVCTSTFILSGESMSSDPATKDRFVNIILDRNKQNIEAKKEIEIISSKLNIVGSYWVRQRTLEDLDTLIKSIREEISNLSALNESKDIRLLTSYAFISVFLIKILNEVDIDINMDDVMKKILNQESVLKVGTDHLTRFWEDFIILVRKNELINGINFYVTNEKILALHWPSIRSAILQVRARERLDSRIDEETLKLYLAQKYKYKYTSFNPYIAGELKKPFKGLGFELSKLPDFVQDQFEEQISSEVFRV